MAPRILITGCSGGGKSALLAELSRLGQLTVPEPGRRIVAEEAAAGGAALPWVDPVRFARRALRMARADLAALRHAAAPVFFDRGTVDAAVALEHHAGIPAERTLGPSTAYSRTVLVAPPWPEIFARDEDRRHDFEAAVAEHDRIVAALARLGHEVAVLPRAPVAERAAFALRAAGLGAPGPSRRS